ncbi:hypothetical protein DdX_19756 [Ditylenchus destructor]|uniref:Uncharacterized protein n=1 Tax=Ditylenchus destructor TaxID=166010 RepID=A0AAD4MIZ7_9BILA|nr:hypothetical protein DdX_19756 [Ditylenchus destructor]
MKRIDNQTDSGTEGVRSSRSEYLDQLLQKQFNSGLVKGSNADHQSDVLNLSDGMQNESQLSHKAFVLSDAVSVDTLLVRLKDLAGRNVVPVIANGQLFLLPADDDDVRTACSSESDCKTAVLSADDNKASGVNQKAGQFSADVLDNVVGDLKAFFAAEFKRLEHLYIKASANANSSTMDRSCADEACASENIGEAATVNDSLEDDCDLRTSTSSVIKTALAD